MNIYRNTPNYYIKRNSNSIYRYKNHNFSTEKRKNYKLFNSTYNQFNNYDGNYKTSLYNFNKNSSLIHNNNYYYQHYKHHNNMMNNNEIIRTIKNSFERLKNKINSLQKIIDDNSIYDKNSNTFNKDINKQNFKSIEKINKSKNIFNNIYINIDKDENKYMIYDNNFIKKEEKNNMLGNIQPHQTFNEKKTELIRNDFGKEKFNKKSRSSNNIIVTNFNDKNKLKRNYLNENNKYKLLNKINSLAYPKMSYLKDNYSNNNIYNNNMMILNNDNNLNNEVIKIVKNESENFSELANDLVNIIQINNPFSDTNQHLNNNINNLMYNNSIINNKKSFKMVKSKENDFILKPNISKVDEGINVRMSLNTSQKKDDNKEEIKSTILKNNDFKISNERISFINNKNLNNKNKLPSDNKIEKNYSISYKLSNNENKEKRYKKISIKNKEKVNENKINKKHIINEKKLISKNKVKENKLVKKKEKIKNEIINITENNNLISKNNKTKFTDNKKLQKNKNKTETNLLYKNKHDLKIKGINNPSKLKIKENSKTDGLKKSNKTNKNKIIKGNKITKKSEISPLIKKENNSKNKKRNINTNINNSNNKIRKQSTTSSEEKNEKLINQIISETELKQKEKGKFHIKFNLEKNTFINYNQNDLIQICLYTDSQNKEIIHKQFDYNIYNEILKSKINIIPIIKKNYNSKNFKINKNYKLNENLDERDIIPDLYLENNDGDFKSLEKTLERSIEKTFNKKYEKRKDENYMSYSDNKKSINLGNENNNKIKGKNLFNQIQQLFQDESQEEEENEDDNNYEDNFDNDDYIINDNGKESFIDESIEDHFSKEDNDIE